ncbi:alpha-glutamyl/putrescinyl thymine pyrophosphorylase clade 3 protein [Maribacter sp. 1_2014MBL_MicDiv]|uniref:alpha-glutamyl/putrescinyl thymine pyrophosphorylase clade 3 protein n=1 Tax=Maribacter sp. 1_2014MBL_MicDiv TaxID=1644130 RepID=UPI0008F48BA0|nr:hypothetical protein [Maribacter sp. 1_2014MBL_MicDiv]APA64253.1 hypothetical protein YQ22_07920 [Maribacter sp. 1_2014MBL_MicDiv]
MKKTDKELYDKIDEKLSTFHEVPLPGIDSEEKKECFIRQIVDSIKRVKYLQIIAKRQSTEDVANPFNPTFNPFLAAVWHKQQGNLDEAFWLVFLATHFGKDNTHGWGLLISVYGKLGSSSFWSWDAIKDNIDDFKLWLYENNDLVKAKGKFSNHRKFQSLNAYSPTGTGSTVQTYLNWIGKSHFDFVKEATTKESNPRKLFNELYRSMDSVIGFGRLGKFDFLTNIGKLGLIDIVPDSTYMSGSSGPKKGAAILFGVNTSNKKYDEWFALLEKHLEIKFGMQVLEDSVCNWQKDILNYSYFSG